MQSFGVAVDVGRETDGVIPPFDGFEELLAVAQRASTQVPAIQVQQVEGVEEQAAVGTSRQGGLEVVKMTAAVWTKGDHLAVEQGGADVERREARGETRHSRCPVVPVPGYQSSLAVVEPDEQAIAVELDFRDPVVSGRRPVGVGGKLRGELGW